MRHMIFNHSFPREKHAKSINIKVHSSKTTIRLCKAEFGPWKEYIQSRTKHTCQVAMISEKWTTRQARISRSKVNQKQDGLKCLNLVSFGAKQVLYLLSFLTLSNVDGDWRSRERFPL